MGRDRTGKDTGVEEIGNGFERSGFKVHLAPDARKLVFKRICPIFLFICRARSILEGGIWIE
jgi:hypothetical protein